MTEKGEKGLKPKSPGNLPDHTTHTGAALLEMVKGSAYTFFLQSNRVSAEEEGPCAPLHSAQANRAERSTD